MTSPSNCFNELAAWSYSIEEGASRGLVDGISNDLSVHDAYEALPDAYRTALRIIIERGDDRAVADELSVPTESVRSLVQLACLKFGRLLEAVDGDRQLSDGSADALDV